MHEPVTPGSFYQKVVTILSSLPELWLGYGLAIVSGLLLMFSWPNAFLSGWHAGQSYLALIAFLPYIIAWQKCGWRGAFVYAWIMGFIYFLGILSWLRLINQNTNLDNAIAWIFFSCCGGIYFGLFGATSKLVVSRLQWPKCLVLPLAWTAWEYLRGHLFAGGWPWGSLGHTQYSNALIRQVAAVAGLGGVAFIVMVINCCLFSLGAFILKLIQTGWPGISPWLIQWQAARKKPVMLSVLGGMLLLWLLLGIIGLQEARQFQAAAKNKIKLVLVQGNIRTNQKWDNVYRSMVMERMQTLHRQAVQAKPDLIVWAESCFPGILDYAPDQVWEDQLRRLVASGGIPTVITSNEYEKEYDLDSQQKYHHYNSAFLLGSQGETIGRYRKIHLVPFGEYIPYNIFKRFLRAVVREPIPVDFEPGEEFTVFTLGPQAFSILICYEDVFEDVACQMAHHGAGFFLTLANNGWAGLSEMIFQHTAMSVFIALEHRTALAKADMTGPTCLIDAWGKISASLPCFQAGILPLEIEWARIQTFYARAGNKIPLAFTFIFGVLLLTAWVFPQRPGDQFLGKG